MSIQWKKESKREREIDTRVGTRIVFIDINAQTTRRRGGEGRLFRGRVEKFNRRMRSDASVMHRSEGFVRGQFALCMKEEGGREGERKRRGDSLARSTMSLSSSNYRAFISWKTSPPLSLSLSFVHCHRWPFLPSVWCIQKEKKKKNPRIDSSLHSIERKKRRLW